MFLFVFFSKEIKKTDGTSEEIINSRVETDQIVLDDTLITQKVDVLCSALPYRTDSCSRVFSCLDQKDGLIQHSMTLTYGVYNDDAETGAIKIFERAASSYTQ